MEIQKIDNAKLVEVFICTGSEHHAELMVHAMTVYCQFLVDNKAKLALTHDQEGVDAAAVIATHWLRMQQARDEGKMAVVHINMGQPVHFNN